MLTQGEGNARGIRKLALLWRDLKRNTIRLSYNIFLATSTNLVENYIVSFLLRSGYTFIRFVAATISGNAPTSQPYIATAPAG